MLKRRDDVFAGRTFDVIQEIHLPLGQVFRTVTGQLARHGWILQDRESGERIAVGHKALKTIRERYVGVNAAPHREVKRTFSAVNRGE